MAAVPNPRRKVRLGSALRDDHFAAISLVLSAVAILFGYRHLAAPRLERQAAHHFIDQGLEAVAVGGERFVDLVELRLS